MIALIPTDQPAAGTIPAEAAVHWILSAIVYLIDAGPIEIGLTDRPSEKIMPHNIELQLHATEIGKIRKRPVEKHFHCSLQPHDGVCNTHSEAVWL